MATFLSKYRELMMPSPKGGFIQFNGGAFETDDKNEIEFIKKSQLFGAYITESSEAVQESVGKRRRVKDAGGE